MWRNDAWRKIFIGLLLIFSFYLMPAAAQEMQKQFKLKDILDGNELSLIGSHSNQTVYLPVPQKWSIDSINLQIQFESSWINAPSTLTASLHNQLLSTLSLSNNFNMNDAWNINIPGELITELTADVMINNIFADDQCSHYHDPRFRLNISGDSLAIYHYHVENYYPDLSKFPFPFINNPTVEKDNVMVILPDQPTLNDYTAAFYLINALANQASWLGVNFNIVSQAALTEQQKNNNHLIYIGTLSELNLSTSIIKWPLNINDKFYDPDHKIIPSDTGIIMLTASPWNAKQAVLAITGENVNAMLKAAKAIHQTDFVKNVLFTQYALIKQDQNQKSNTSLNEKELTFSELNFANQTLFGGNKNTIHYNLNLPPDKKFKGLDITFHYSNSGFSTKKEQFYLTFYLNGIPTDGLIIHHHNIRKNTWKIHVNGDHLLSGANQLTLVFSVYKENTHCKPDEMDAAWIKIKDSSTLHLDVNDNKLTNFQIFKSLTKDVLISLPEQMESMDFMRLLLKLATIMPNLNNVTFIYHSDFLMDKLGDHNVIYLDIASFQDFPTYFLDAPFLLQSKQLRINRGLLPHVLTSKENPIGLYEVYRSPTYSDRMNLLILAATPKDLINSLQLYLNQKNANLNLSDAVLIYKNGFHAALKTDQFIVLEHQRLKMKKIILSTIILCIFLIYLIVKIRRNSLR